MSANRKGIHHISIISGDGQTNANFYVKKLGLRMVLKTVNQDDPGSYHLFYANGSGQPGSSITFFPWPGARQGEPSSGQVTAISFSAPEQSLDYWLAHFDKQRIHFEEPAERFGLQTLTFFDPDHLKLELVFDGRADSLPAWEGGPVPAEYGIRGFWSSTLKLEETGPTADVLEQIMGFREKQKSSNLTLYQTEAPIGHSIIIEEADAPSHGLNGRGIIHHIAFRTKNREELEQKRLQVIGMGLSPTGIIDRHVFRSVYFQSPGGVLFEMASDDPGYASVLAEGEEMGKNLFLPPWLEPKRTTIESRLPEITL